MNKGSSPVRWPGGKRLARERIIKMFPKHRLYTECFGGALWVLFGKEPSHSEIVNDLNSMLINFFNVVRDNPYQLIAELQWDLYSRKTFDKYKEKLENDIGISDVEKAKLFFYILKASFAGQMRNFGYSRTEKPPLNFNRISEIIISAHEWLKRVTIENLCWRKFIPKYDAPHALHYFDPPYRVESSSRMYVKAFTDEDYVDFKHLLNGLKGMFILSINDDPFIRELFKEYKIEELKTRYSIASNQNKAVTELIIKNF